MLRPVLEDSATRREMIRKKAVEGLAQAFPIKAGKHTLELTNVRIDPREYSSREQKRAVLEGRTLSERVRGDVTVKDAAGVQVDHVRDFTLMQLPYFTPRHTFIVDGTEYSVSNQLRQKPGAYVRRRGNEELEAGFNLSKGANFKVSMDAEKGLLYMQPSHTTSRIPLHPVLRALGVPQQDIAAAWGHDVAAINRDTWKTPDKHVDKLYETLIHPARQTAATPEERTRMLREYFDQTVMDPEVNLHTLGYPYDKASPASILAASKKLLDIHKAAADVDDRDSLAFKTFHSVDDFVKERIQLDARVMRAKLGYKLDAAHGNLKKALPAGPFTRSLRDLLTGSSLSAVPMQINPLELLDEASRVTMLGEGGIASERAIPLEARDLHPTHLGIIDPARSPECFDDKTEVFTSKGWKAWPSVTDADWFACRVGQHLEFHHALNLTAQRYDGPMYGLMTGKIDYLVTPNHRVLCKPIEQRGAQVWRVNRADEVHGKPRTFDSGHDAYTGETVTTFQLPPVTGGNAVKNVESVAMPDWASFMGWFLSEGSFAYNETTSTYHVLISQDRKANPTNCQIIEALLSRLPFTWCFRTNDTFVIGVKQLAAYVRQFGHAGDKYIPEYFFHASIEVRENLFEALLLGDGRRCVVPLVGAKHDRNVLCTTSPRLAADFERLAISLGHTTRTHVYVDNREARYLDTYEIRVLKQRFRQSRTTTGRGYYIEAYAGVVYCAEVPGGLLYVRRNNSVPLWSGNSFKIGVDLRMAIGAKRDDKGDVYAPVRDVKSGKETWLKAADMSKAIVAFPGEHVAPGKLVDAMKNGVVSRVNANEVTHQIIHDADQYGPTSNLLPFVYGIQGNRVLMASKHQGQALPLVHREAPLVQVESWKPGVSVEREMVRLIVPTAPHAGTISKIDEDYIHVMPGEHKTSAEATRLHYDQNFPLAAKTMLHNTLTVREGDRVEKGQPLAESNFTKDGTLALGTNLRVAYMPYRGLNTNDGIVVSQGAADRLLSEHMYQSSIDKNDTTKLNREKHRAYFGSRYTKAQYDKLDENGVVRPGVTLLPGDPLIVGVREAHTTGDAALLGKLSKSLVKPFDEVVETWGHDKPGTVVDVADTGARVSASVRTHEALQIGDKLCFDGATEILTRQGWKRVADVTTNDEVCTLQAGNIVYEHPKATHAYPIGGRMYVVKSQQVDFAVTVDHKMYVQRRGHEEFELLRAEDIAGKRVRFKKNGNWAGMHRSEFVFPALEVRAGQSGHGTRTIPAIHMPMNTFLMLLGAFLSEGNVFDQPGNYGIDITQTKEPNRQRLIDALTAANVSFGAGPEKIRIHSKQLLIYFKQFGKAADKFIPDELFELPPEQLRVLFTWLMWGDGTTKANGLPVAYYTVSPRLADDVQRLCLHAGWAANVARIHEGGPVVIMGRESTAQPFYRVGIVTTKLEPQINHGHTKKQAAQEEGFVENYERPVYCVTVPGHILYVRRNGKPAWCGNCNRYGNKGVIAKVVPDHQMIQDEKGRPMDILFTSAGIVSRINPAQVIESMLGKVAEKTGKPILVPPYVPGRDNVAYARKLLEDHGLTDKETVLDPITGKKIPDIMVGKSYILKLFKTTDSNWSAHGSERYDYNQQPARGGDDGAKGIGKMEFDGLVAHNARNILREAASIKSQRNDEFWRAVQLGLPTPAPKSPFAYDKLLGMLTGAGVKVNKTGSRLSLGPLTDADIKSMSAGALKDPQKLIRAKDLHPEIGGLFDPATTGGMSGTKWSHVDLAEPIVNPVFEEPVRRLLGLTQKEFTEHVGKGGTWFKNALGAINIDDKLAELRTQSRKARGPVLDGVVKQIKYLEALKERDLKPEDAYVLSKVPVTPPIIRPILPLKDGKLQVGDANLLYKDAFLANDQLRGAKESLPGPEHVAPRQHLYEAMSALFGVGEPVSPGAEKRGAKGYLAAITGTRPGSGFFQSRIMKRQQDVSGRATIAPDPTLSMDEIGIPEDMLHEMYGKFVIGRLVRRGYSATDAQKMVDEKTPLAREELTNESRERPVLINRAPSLHRFNIVAAYPKLIEGKTLKLNPFAEKGMNADYDGDCIFGVVIISITNTDYGQIPENVVAWWHARELDPSMTARFNVVTGYTVGDRFFVCDLADFPHGNLQHEHEHRSFYDVPDAVRVLSYDATTGGIHLAKPLSWSIHRDRVVQLVNLASGRQIVTDDDPRAVFGVTRELEVTLRRPRASEGVFVPVARHLSPLEPMLQCIDNTTIPQRSNRVNISKDRKKRMHVQHPLDEAFGRLCGMLVGDGWVDVVVGTPTAVHLAAIEESIQTAYRTLVTALFEEEPTIGHVQRTTAGYGPDSQKLKVSSIEFATLMHPLIGSGARNKHLPPFFLFAPEEYRKGLLGGLFDTDGSIAVSNGKAKPQWIINHSTTSLRLAREIVLLYKSLNVVATITAARTPKDNTCWIVTPSSVELRRLGSLPIAHERKRERFERFFAETSNPSVGGYAGTDIVPVPRHVALELRTRYKQGSAYTVICRTVKCGYMTRVTASRILDEHPELRTRANFEAWCRIVDNTTVSWDRVTSWEAATTTETGYDLTVPGYETFMAVDGTVLSNTVQVHAPVTPAGIEDAKKMTLSNLIFSDKRPGALNIVPEMESLLGLHRATRAPSGKKTRHFASTEEAMAAYHRGDISLNDPVEIEH